MDTRSLYDGITSGDLVFECVETDSQEEIYSYNQGRRTNDLIMTA